MLFRTGLILLCALFGLWAQSPLGSVTGLATDPSGSVVPDATVRLKSVSTSLERELRTNASGNFVFPNLQPGGYALTAEAKGFKKIEMTGLALAAFQTLRQDLKFAVATAATEVTIAESASAVIATESPSITSGLTSRQILELPTNLRGVSNAAGDSGLIFHVLPLTIPGVVQMQSGAFWMVPGGGPNGTRLKVDGIETNFGLFGSADSVSQPSTESVEEFTANIVTNRAEFSGIGTITTVTRAGSNQARADVYWVARNSALDSRNAFQAAKPYQNIHNFGASGGGAIKRDKTFVMATADLYRGSRAYSFTSNVPTLAMRQGDFSAIGAVRDPFAGNAPFADNRIPAARFSTQAARAQDLLYPLPNFGAPTLNAGNYRAAFNGPETHRILELRLDHNFSSAHSAFARYQHKKDDYDIPGARSALPPLTVGTSKNLRRLNFWTLGDIWTLRPNMFNEARAGIVYLESRSSSNILGQSLLDQIGIRGLPVRPATGAPGVPNFAVTGLSTFSQVLLNPVDDAHWQISDNLTWVKGRHSMKFGGELVHWFVNRYQPWVAALYGNFSFQNRFSNQPYGDFLLGLPTQVGRIDPAAVQRFRWNNFAFYAQDDFKLTRRLSLSYGLRYEFNQPALAQADNLYSFNPATGSAMLASQAARSLVSSFYPSTLPITNAEAVNLGRSLRRADRNNLAPRFGFSYLVTGDGKSVIRGGWGIYYAPYSAAAVSNQVGGPFAVSTTANNAITDGRALFTLETPFALPGSAGTLNLNAIPPGLQNSYSMQFSFSVEREVLKDLGFRLSYIGSKGTQLPYQRNINQPVASTVAFAASRRPWPIYNTIAAIENGANSNYHGLQTGVTKRMSRGLQFASTWIWAKSLSEVDDTSSADVNTAIEDAYDRRRERANSQSVPRHQWMNNVLWEVPWAKGKAWGGWQWNALINFATGHWLNPQFSGSDPSNTNTVGGRPDVVGPITYPHTLLAWYTRTAFAAPPAGVGRFGNAGRNIIEGPGYAIFNLGLAKTTHFEKLGNVQVSATFQNVLNHVNYGIPSMAVNNPVGGTITGSHIFNPAGSARTGQLSLRWRY